VAVVVRLPGERADGGVPESGVPDGGVPDGGVPDGGAFLIVRRPDDPADPLAGVWGLPAITLLDGEDERAAAARAGRVKLGVELAVGARIGEKTADRGGYVLRLADYEATIAAGTPAVPQPDESMTQYTACQFTADPAALDEAAARGSLCAQLFLEDNSKKRLAARDSA
jgi:8-oxo-dGTP diphosphatase